MGWLLIDDATGAVAGGPFDDPPEATEGFFAVEIAIGCVWSPERRAFVEARRRLSPLEFLRLLTPAEVVAIDTYPVVTPPGQLLRYAARIAQTAEYIDLDGSEVAAFLLLAQQLQILSADRVVAIRAGAAPGSFS